MKTGILLVNLGTPDSFQTADVRKYLRQFLMDGRVIDIPWLPRFLLVYAGVLGLNMALLDLGMRAGLPALLAQAVILPIFALTFLVMRRFVFAASPEQTS